MIEFLEKNLNPQAFALVLLCICVIYIWYLHLRNKLLKEQIEFEKEKRENFLNELQKLKSAPPSKQVIKKTLNSKRILIVDDEPWLREMIMSVLLRHYPGIKLSEASDGVEALELIALDKPSVLITDVMGHALSDWC
jgi:PleD family two-component response regulator